jgi:hypothetical protein
VALFNRVASHAGNDCEFETRSTGSIPELLCYCASQGWVLKFDALDLWIELLVASRLVFILTRDSLTSVACLGTLFFGSEAGYAEVSPRSCTKQCDLRRYGGRAEGR